MRRLVQFTVLAVVFEGIALAIALSLRVTWLLEVIVGLFVLYFIAMGIRGWRRAVSTQLPQLMTGRVVRRRHWHLF